MIDQMGVISLDVLGVISRTIKIIYIFFLSVNFLKFFSQCTRVQFESQTQLDFVINIPAKHSIASIAFQSQAD